ncbi:MAG TPA: hypothetical protein VGN12_27635 [Pirellulales bacterium]|jgi:hypothetical protein
MLRSRLFIALMTVTSLVAVVRPCPADESAKPETISEKTAETELVWETDYSTAMQQAERQKKMLLIHFVDEVRPAPSEPFLKQVRENEQVRAKLAKFVLLRLPVDVQVNSKGTSTKLLDHPSFAEMEKHQGLAVVDYANPGTEHYSYVVSTLPFKSGKYYHYNPKHVAVLLDLPPGTQTQRALVFAVRIHPEAPASTKGEMDPQLVREAKSHSQYQANIRVQGHHHWDSRFPRIHSLLGFGLTPQEVVAESWPHENLLDAAVDCVQSWRQSSGHWGAVKRSQPKFAYDMRRGSNGIWYATGIFGNRY